jgi:hypothetical protein
MIKKYFSCMLALFFCCGAQAQQLDLSFTIKPTIHTLCNPEFAKESAVVIAEQEQIIYSNNFLDDDLTIKKRVHKIVKINDEKGVELFNKVRIPFGASANVTAIEARTILPNGNVINIAESDVKEVKEEDGTMYKLFALQGVEKGVEIEYYYEIKQALQFYGGTYMQDEIPTCVNEFELVAPREFVFALKAYNGAVVLPVKTLDSTASYLARAENLEGLQEEKYATYFPHFASVQYVLANKSNGLDNDKLYTWDALATTIYRNFTAFDAKALKNVAEILDGNTDFKACNTMQSKIEFIENYVKTNYQQQEYIEDPNASDLAYTIKNKYTDEHGITTLFAALFTAHNIPFEIGYTSDRNRTPFDYDFETPSCLTDCVFYFPGINQYMAPNAVVYRMPFLPVGNYGNPIMFTNATDKNYIRAEKKIIPYQEPALSAHDHEVDVTFNADMDTAIIEFDNYFLGHNAIDVLPALIYLDAEKRKEFTEQVLGINGKKERMENMRYENASFNSITEGKRVKIGATIYASNSVEKAGPKYIFKIGELIGLQAEMYQEKTRKFDIEIPNKHQYTRTIKVHIPKGLKPGNLDKLKMDVAAMDGNKEICSFRSDYTLVGNLLTVNIFEIYHNTFTSKAFYEPYVKVINAAADFNKVVIVLAK